MVSGGRLLFLREYLYVDLIRVEGLASQLYNGVPERAVNVAARQKQLQADFKLIGGGLGSSSEESVERSLRDSLFKDVETDLEALGLLTDVSIDLATTDSWNKVDELIAPGNILRITAPGTLFHPAQMSDAIVGIATAAHGLADLGIKQDDAKSSPPVPPRAKSESQKQAERTARQQVASEPKFAEDMVPHGEHVPFMNVSRSLLTGMIRVVRGVFADGVHLQLRPAGADGAIISARLEEGRRFLDSPPEILFSRYGLFEQEWTIVGVVGQMSPARDRPGVTAITNSDGSVNRAKLVDLVADFLGKGVGLVDLPKAPGFSMIPLAVYRPVGQRVASA